MDNRIRVEVCVRAWHALRARVRVRVRVSPVLLTVHLLEVDSLPLDLVARYENGYAGRDQE